MFFGNDSVFQLVRMTGWGNGELEVWSVPI